MYIIILLLFARQTHSVLHSLVPQSAQIIQLVGWMLERLCVRLSARGHKPQLTPEPLSKPCPTLPDHTPNTHLQQPQLPPNSPCLLRR